jgi:hypothetical protein
VAADPDTNLRPHTCGAGGSLCEGEGMSARGMCPRPAGHYGQQCEGEVPLGFQVYEATSTEAGETHGWHHMFDYGGDKGEWITVDIRVEIGTPGEADSRIVAGSTANSRSTTTSTCPSTRITPARRSSSSAGTTTTAEAGDRRKSSHSIFDRRRSGPTKTAPSSRASERSCFS